MMQSKGTTPNIHSKHGNKSNPPASPGIVGNKTTTNLHSSQTTPISNGLSIMSILNRNNNNSSDNNNKNSQPSSTNKFHRIPIEILDDLSSRFIINLPEDERRDIVRVMFQIELAHWFYIDFHCVEKVDLPKLHLKTFAKVMFEHLSFLRCHLPTFDAVMDKWREYKSNVPTYGAIIVDESYENVLMVQGFWSNSSWGFPKGKVNADEEPLDCAVREVKEEIGFDCTSLIKANEYIEMCIRDTFTRLYIVTGVSLSEKFQPMTRGEIKHIQWFSLKNLPNNKSEKDLNSKHFFIAIPFIKQLKRWISDHVNSQTLQQAPCRNRKSFSQKSKKDFIYFANLLRKPNEPESSADDLAITKSIFCVDGKPVKWIKTDDKQNSTPSAEDLRFGSSSWTHFHLDLNRLWDEALSEFVSFG